jgi:hypothetical protein
LLLLGLKINSPELGSFPGNLRTSQLLQMLVSHLCQLLLQMLQLLFGGLLFAQLFLCAQQMLSGSFQLHLQLLHSAILTANIIIKS